MPAELLNVNPMVILVDDFLSSKVCNELIDQAKPKIERSTVAHEKGPRVHNGRTSSHTFVRYRFTELYEFVGIDYDYAEDVQVTRYLPGQSYQPHQDAFPENSPYTRRSGQRVLTAIVCLTDGGRIWFPEINIEIDSQRGSLIVFTLCKLGSNIRDERAKHGAEAEDTERWSATVWFREKQFKSGDVT